jgi:hypothetical protein
VEVLPGLRQEEAKSMTRLEEQYRAQFEQLSSRLENHPLVNEEIVAQYMAAKYDLALAIGGDEATISECVAIVREALIYGNL